MYILCPLPLTANTHDSGKNHNELVCRQGGKILNDFWRCDLGEFKNHFLTNILQIIYDVYRFFLQKGCKAFLKTTEIHTKSVKKI